LSPNSLFLPLQAALSLLRRRGPNVVAVKAFRLWKRAGFWAVLLVIRHQWRCLYRYQHWVKKYGTLSEEDRLAIRTSISGFEQRPLISVLMPTYNSSERWLRQAISSVQNQLYSNWELCIADDASTQGHVRVILEEYRQLDGRIKVVQRAQNGHISASSNSALELASGDFTALLDHDDELAEHALYQVALAINKSPGLNLIYSDEDKIDERGRRFGPYFKPDWNPDLLNAQNMVSHLGVYRTNVLRAVGGFRTGVEGSQDWDLALRVAEQVPASTIHHIPDVLYHWRAIPGSTAITYEEKAYVASASQQVVLEHMQRVSQTASVKSAFNSFVRVQYPVADPPPLVSIIVFGDGICLTEELSRLTDYSSFEIVPCPFNGSQNRSRALNEKVKQSTGELLCFLDSAFLPADAGWLKELAAQASRPAIGAAGPLQLNADTIKAALTVLCPSTIESHVTWNVYQGTHASETGVGGRAALQQNVSVLAPGCLILRRSVFQEMGGFDAENFPCHLFELDLCLRLIRSGYRNVWTPYARVVHACNDDTPLPKDHSRREVDRFHERWREFMQLDPAHNPNLACGGAWQYPALTPRISRPWYQEQA
jgi:O-antigen biosynthesis protein